MCRVRARREGCIGSWWGNRRERIIQSNTEVIKSRRMRWAGHVARISEGRGVYRVLVGKPEGKTPLGRPTCRWVDIRMDLWDVGIWTGLDWPKKETGAGRL